MANQRYDEQEVRYENKQAAITLAGTLSVPYGHGPFPAVILIAGAGPQDRDGTVYGHKLFLIIADYLANYGIAVLRVDKRGVGKSIGNYSTATIKNFADDVCAGVEYLKWHPDIDRKYIGLIGYSEGGIIAPLVAVQSKDIAFIIMLAGTGVNGKDLLHEQAILMGRAQGVSEEIIACERLLRQQLFDIQTQEEDFVIAKERMRELMEKYVAELQKKEQGSLSSLEVLKNMVESMNAAWQYFLAYEPASALKQLQISVLVLNGELDLQVSAKQNLPAIVAALKEAGNPDYTIFELPKLNHLFQECKIGSVAEYATLKGSIVPEVLEIVTDWIVARVKKNRYII